MNKPLQIILNLILVGVCLGPTVFFLSIGSAFGLAAVFRHVSLEDILMFTGIIIIPIYALFCVLWLAVKQNRIAIQNVPVKIWLGLAAGHIVMVIFFVEFGSKLYTWEGIVVAWVVGLGPAVYSWLLLAWVYHNQTLLMKATEEELFVDYNNYGKETN